MNPQGATEALCACGCGRTGRILCRGMLAACYQRVRRAGDLPQKPPPPIEDDEPYEIQYVWSEQEPQPAIDPDILAIQRKRRREGRCIACGKRERKNGRPAALCARCRATLAYCPSCEALYPRPANMRASYSSAFCCQCNTLHTRNAGGHRSLDAYLIERRADRHRVLPEIVRLYKRGQSFAQIGAALGLPERRINTLIKDARRQGEWPKGLRRRA